MKPDIKKRIREMVAYVIDTKDSEIINSYTETFYEIFKESIFQKDIRNKTLEDVDMAINELEISDGYIKADQLKEHLKTLKL